MDYRISISENLQYAVIKYYVDMTTEISIKSGPELVTFLIDNDLHRILFDLRDSSNIQSVTDNYYFANEGIKTFGFPRGMVSAFLVRTGDYSHNFITTAFQNAGYLVDKFTDLEEAEKWLASK